MDWELERGKKTSGWKNHAKYTQDANLKRVVLDKNCSICNSRLIKQTIMIPMSEWNRKNYISEQYRVWYATPETCKDCKDVH